MALRFLIVIGVMTLAACSGTQTGSGTDGSSSGVSAQTPLPAVAPGESLLQLAWQPNNDGVVAGYRVYYGATGDEATNQASDLALNSTNFNPQAPVVFYNAQRDLGLVAGQNVCFRLRAYNNQGTLSPWSAPVCGNV